MSVVRENAHARGLESAAEPPAASARTPGKRALDVALAAPLTLLLLPLIAVAAAAVRLESGGPALFAQERVGLEGRRFRMWKLRSMRADAPDGPHREAAGAWFEGREGPEGYKRADDARVTRVGRLLRSTSLDELPQLFNVLRGDMSLVGPRPAIPYELDLYEAWYFERQRVRPGITGLWQVNGRDRVSARGMMELDIRYVRTWSFGLDLRILLWTAPALFGRYGRL